MNKKRIEQLLDIELNTNRNTPLGDFVESLVSKCIRQEEISRGYALAASFDLLVGLFYYQKIVQQGWMQCPNGEPHYFFPYVNVCPRCALEGKFIYHKAGKGQSANIGAATIEALILFVREWFKQTGRDLTVIQGEEPVDLIIYDKKANTAFVAEVKSAPLFTLPLAVQSEIDGEPLTTHEEINLASFRGAKLGLLLPTINGSSWDATMYYFSEIYDKSEDYFITELTKLILDESKDFLDNYLKTWVRAFDAYSDKKKNDNIFWLTGGCGKPSSKLWSHSTSISDGKTSVGMDRTDDIKKGVYQLLKLRMIDAVKEGINIKVGILSNAHAARHYESYIQPIQNVMWLISEQENVETTGDLPRDTAVHNLYDGIVTFTKSHTRDKWLQKIFNFDEKR
jgi:hypothetical protein